MRRTLKRTVFQTSSMGQANLGLIRQDAKYSPECKALLCKYQKTQGKALHSGRMSIASFRSAKRAPRMSDARTPFEP